MTEDLDRLADLPDGVLRIDVLRGAANHSKAGPIDLHVVVQLFAWLSERLTSLALRLSQLSEVRVEADIRTDRITTDRNRIVSFDFDCRSRVATEKAFERRLRETHRWHRRAGA